MRQWVKFKILSDFLPTPTFPLANDELWECVNHFVSKEQDDHIQQSIQESIGGGISPTKNPTKESMSRHEKAWDPGRWTRKKMSLRRGIPHKSSIMTTWVPFLCLSKEVWMWGSWRWNAYGNTIMPQNPGKKPWENTQSTFLLRDLIYHDYITEMGTVFLSSLVHIYLPKVATV